jgi:uncharacterized protein (DUF1778 family)
MASEKKKRGGSDTAREKGLTGIVVHVSKEQRQRIGAAAALAGAQVKAFCTALILDGTDKFLKEHKNRLD